MPKIMYKDKNYSAGTTNTSDVDSVLSTTSENPVQNKVITSELDNTVKLRKNFQTTVSGKEVAKKVFTSDDIAEDGSLSMKLKPSDTIDIKPSSTGYEYGLSYMPDNGDDAYTYCMGKFIVKPSCGTVNDLTS